MTTKSTKRPKLFPLFTTPALKFKFIRFSLVHSSKQKSPSRTYPPKPDSPTKTPELSPGTVLGRGLEYTLVRPLGNGGFSTVWLAQTDKEDVVDDDASFHTALTYLSPPASNLVAIKVLTTAGERTRELSKHLRLDHPPDQLVKLLDHFTFSNRNERQSTENPGKRSRRVSFPSALPARHNLPIPAPLPSTCLVLSLHGPTLSDLRQHLSSRWLPLPIVRRITNDVLAALDFLHSQHLVHADVQPRNILLSLPDALSLNSSEWRFVLADLGHAVQLPHKRHSSSNVQPHALRAPEVILGLNWDEKIDVWNLGCLVYEFATGGPLFDPFFQPTPDYEAMTPAQVHLLQIIEQVGEVPQWMKDPGTRGRAGEFYDSDGTFRCPFPLQMTSLEAIVKGVWKIPSPASGDREHFCAFLRTIVCVDPQKRLSAREVRLESWVKTSPAYTNHFIPS
ncbi:kinase-like domain-containing protein [Desarmillaria tabescens]|uniref:Kinase-like domain-containing protein n=1 Tax=Armillaria tabescens TaxID=1929756 RepID=A0AA39NNU7_ARMTA|nr:kinase-like domain-containing protein [Desarmillaria tabescens]KAK0469056.1 kinase-like domain-containing protein [Desarmillaria tabescens]